MHVVFVCSGNICRSPMAETVFRAKLADAGLAAQVRTGSAAIGPWHAGEPMDPRAAKTLIDHGYPAEHTAAQVDDAHLAADLLLAMDSGHFRELRRQVHNCGGDPGKVRMFRSFDPAAGEDDEVPDPYYGGPEGFDQLLAVIETATAGLLRWTRERL